MADNEDKLAGKRKYSPTRSKEAPDKLDRERRGRERADRELDEPSRE